MKHASALLIACVGCTDPASPTGDCDTGKCDDLVDRDLLIIPYEPPKPVTRPSSVFTVRPTIEEQGRLVTIRTDDFRAELDQLQPPGEVQLIRVEQGSADPGSRFGFRIQMRPAAGYEWETVNPFPEEMEWQWTMATLRNTGNGVIQVSGVLIRYTDTFGGLDLPEQALRDIPEFDVPVRSTEFRVLVLPLWNWFDFDETGYNAELAYDPFR